MAKRRRRLYPAGENPAAGHTDKYAGMKSKSAEVAYTPPMPQTQEQVRAPLTLWRPILMSDENLAAFAAVRAKIEPTTINAKEMDWRNPDKTSFKILGATAVGRALYAMPTNERGYDSLHTALKKKFGQTAGGAIVAPASNIIGLQATPDLVSIRVNVAGPAHQEMVQATAALNEAYGTSLKPRSHSSFELGRIKGDDLTPFDVTSKLRGIHMGEVLLGAMQMPEHYEPLYY